MRKLRARLEEEKLVPRQQLLEKYSYERARIQQIHYLTCEQGQDKDDIFVATMYQDGILHQLEDIVSQGRLGRTLAQYNQDLLGAKAEYQTALRARKVEDIAYYQGRVVALASLIQGNEGPLPERCDPETYEPRSAFVL